MPRVLCHPRKGLWPACPSLVHPPPGLGNPRPPLGEAVEKAGGVKWGTQQPCQPCAASEWRLRLSTISWAPGVRSKNGGGSCRPTRAYFLGLGGFSNSRRGLQKEGPVCLGQGNVWGAVQVSRQGLTRGLWTGPLCLRRSGNLKNGGGASVGFGGPWALPPAGSGRHGSGIPKRTRGSESRVSCVLASSSPAHGAAPRATRGGRTCGTKPVDGENGPFDVLSTPSSWKDPEGGN